MVREVETVDELQDEERLWSDSMEAVMGGESLEDNSRGLKKNEVEELSREIEDFEDDLLNAGDSYLSIFDVDAQADDADLIVVEDEEDIEQIDHKIDTTNNAAYIHDENEVLIFTDSTGVYTAFDPLGCIAHELKHRDQELRYEGTVLENNPVTEASTQLLNMYREGILENNRKVRQRIESLESSDYPEGLAEETELAAESYNNLLENDNDPDEAMSFMLNEYEERRIDR